MLQVLAFSLPWDLEWKSRSFKVASSCIVFSDVYQHTKFGRKKKAHGKSKRKPVYKINISYKFTQVSSLPWQLMVWNKAWGHLQAMAAHKISSKMIKKKTKKNKKKKRRKIEYKVVGLTLHIGQGHSSWYQTVESSNVYHQIKFARNQFVNVQTQPKGFFLPNKSPK